MLASCLVYIYNNSFVDEYLILNKSDIDGASKSNKFDDDFKMKFIFEFMKRNVSEINISPSSTELPPRQLKKCESSIELPSKQLKKCELELPPSFPQFKDINHSNKSSMSDSHLFNKLETNPSPNEKIEIKIDK